MLFTPKEKKNKKEVGGNFRGDGNVYGLDCSDGFTGVCLSPNHRAVYIKYVQIFICQTYLNNFLQ